ncbi:MAG: hypothetical protein ACXACX_04045 [Candidatus Hodarchaeales archaeon]
MIPQKLLAYARKLRSNNSYDLALGILQDSLEYPSLDNNPIIFAEFLLEISYNFFGLAKYGEANTSLKTAWDLVNVSQIIPKSLQVDILRALGRSELVKNPEESVKWFRKTLEMLENLKKQGTGEDKIEKFMTVNERNTSEKKFNAEEFDELRVLAERDPIELHLARVQADLGLAYRILGDFESAIGNLHVASKVFEKVAVHDSYLESLIDLSITQILMSSFQEAYENIDIILEISEQNPVYSNNVPELLLHILKGFIFWQLQLKQADYAFQQASTTLKTTNSYLLEGLYYLLHGIYDFTAINDFNSKLKQPLYYEYLTSALVRWRSLKLYPPLIDTLWITFNSLIQEIAHTNNQSQLGKAEDTLKELEELWPLIRNNLENEEKRLLVIIQYSRIQLEIIKKGVAKTHFFGHYLRQFQKTLKIARRQQILDIRLVVYARVFYFLLQLDQYKDEKEKIRLLALLDDFGRDIKETKVQVLNQFFLIFKSKLIVYLDFKKVTQSINLLNEAKELISDPQFTHYVDDIGELEKQWQNYFDLMKKNPEEVQKLLIKFRKDTKEDMLGMFSKFFNQYIFQFLIIPSRILTMADWKKKFDPTEIISLFQSPSEFSSNVSQFSFSIPEEISEEIP